MLDSKSWLSVPQDPCLWSGQPRNSRQVWLLQQCFIYKQSRQGTRLQFAEVRYKSPASRTPAIPEHLMAETQLFWKIPTGFVVVFPPWLVPRGGFSDMSGEVELCWQWAAQSDRWQSGRFSSSLSSKTVGGGDAAGIHQDTWAAELQDREKVKKSWGPRTPERYMDHWGASQGRGS